jgi:hypothetical protein
MMDGSCAARLCPVIETEPEEDDDIRDFGLRQTHGVSFGWPVETWFIPTGGFVILRAF